MTGSEHCATYVALLRGINVGGRNSLPMAQLVEVFSALGAEQVKTYIQSGNVVFRYDAEGIATLGQKVGASIQDRFGFEPKVLVLPQADLEAAINNNPFSEAESFPNSLHVGFLASPPTHPDVSKMEELKTTSERFQLMDRTFFLHAPDGIGRSKLAASSERLLGVPMTMRNWKTVGKLWALAMA